MVRGNSFLLRPGIASAIDELAHCVEENPSRETVEALGDVLYIDRESLLFFLTSRSKEFIRIE